MKYFGVSLVSGTFHSPPAGGFGYFGLFHPPSFQSDNSRLCTLSHYPNLGLELFVLSMCSCIEGFLTGKGGRLFAHSLYVNKR